MAIGVILYRYDYRQLQKPHMLQRIMIVTLIGMVLVLVAGSVINGARRWIVIGPVSIQPSEFAKLAAIIWTSAKLSTMRKWGKSRYNNPLTNLQGYVSERVGYMLPMLVWPIIFAVLTILQPDMGTTVLIFGFSFILIYLAGFDSVLVRPLASCSRYGLSNCARPFGRRFWRYSWGRLYARYI